MGQFLTVIVKPTLDCNLHCRHCYHELSDRSDLLMDQSIYEKVVRMVKGEYDYSRYIWHGGEPLLAPMSFYKKAFAVQKKYYGKEGCDNTIQTSGSLLNQRFIEFCKSNRVNLGVSYECGFDAGLRPDMDVAHVDSMVKYMADKGHMFLVSATIHGGNVDRMGDMYDKCRQVGATLSFNPIINLGCARNCPDLVLDPDVYIERSNELFDRWIHDTQIRVPILPFNMYIQTVMNKFASVSDCPHSSCIKNWICVYPNGDVYPCGKACPKDFLLGNVKDIDHISDLFESEGFRNIIIGSIERRKKCRSCEIYDLCNGGCSIDALADGDMESPNGASCRIYKGIITHIRDTIQEIMDNKPDMNQYNGFVKDAVLGRLINPHIVDTSSMQ